MACAKELLNLLYNIEESIYYNYSDDDVDYNEELKSLLSKDFSNIKYFNNWFYKNRVYKTININSIITPYSKNLYQNVLYGLLLRENSRYDLNSKAFELNIIFRDDNIDTIDTKELSNLHKLSCFNCKRVILKDNVELIRDLKETLTKNDYEIVYEVVSLSELSEDKHNVHLIVTDVNISKLEDFIIEAKRCNVKKMYITSSCKSCDNRSYYRSNINKLVYKHMTLDFHIINVDFIYGQHLYIDDYMVGLKNNFSIQPSNRTNHLFTDVKSLKLCHINHTYLLDQCEECPEKVLCMLGVSDVPCNHKIL